MSYDKVSPGKKIQESFNVIIDPNECGSSEV